MKISYVGNVKTKDVTMKDVKQWNDQKWCKWWASTVTELL